MKVVFLIIAGLIAAGFLLIAIWFVIVYTRDKRRLKSLKVGDDVIIYIETDRILAKVSYVDHEDETVTVTYLNTKGNGRFFSDIKVVNIEDINFPTI